jgi:hypothetical protein
MGNSAWYIHKQSLIPILNQNNRGEQKQRRAIESWPPHKLTVAMRSNSPRGFATNKIITKTASFWIGTEGRSRSQKWNSCSIHVHYPSRWEVLPSEAIPPDLRAFRDELRVLKHT